MPWPGLQAYHLRHSQVDTSAGFGESVQRLRYPSAFWVCGYAHKYKFIYIYLHMAAKSVTAQDLCLLQILFLRATLNSVNSLKIRLSC